MPYWISQTLAGVPAFLWVYVALGGVWALALLPRDQWRRRAQVVALAFALGPALLTAWMFVLGTVGAASQTAAINPPSVMLGTVVLFLVGLALAWRKWRQLAITRDEGTAPLLADERLLIGLVIAALVVRWIVVAYWTFTAYDALWVYGYEGRLYALLGYISQSIGYYPQFLPLQFTYAQMSGINDHAARAVLPLLHWGSILAAYVLGARLFDRRTGIILAAIWALYPHVGEWARAGDLEIPLAFAFTLAAAFFLLAWLGHEPRRRHALIAGLLVGVGMWIKPTMGAFALGVVLLLLLDLIRVRFNLRRWLPRLEVALIAGVAAVPLGGVWYLRNLLLGHDVLVFPPGFWQTLAQRSGGEFGWLLAGLVVWIIYLIGRYPRHDWWFGRTGVALVLIALVPSILDPRPLEPLEFALLAGGVLLLALELRRILPRWDDELKALAAKVGWGLALALPYFLTWFYAYSYHYRLSFAVVPLLILPIAAVLARWITPERFKDATARLLYFGIIVLIALPGVIAAVYDLNGGGDYLWTDKYPNDHERYRSGNAALINVVDGLQVWLDEHPGETLVVSAPGVERLPFFFPLQDIRVDAAPTRLADLDDAAYFVYGYPETEGEYQAVPITDNQVVGALHRQDIMRRAWGLDDSIFRYDVYELNLANRWQAPEPNGAAQQDVIFGGFARYLGYDIGGLDLWEGRRVILHLYWEVIAPAPGDYSIFIHLRDADDGLIASWDGPVARDGDRYYSMLVWEPGEYISDERVIMLPEDVTSLGEGYRMVIGIYDSLTNERLPVMVDGQPAGMSYAIEDRIAIVPNPEG